MSARIETVDLDQFADKLKGWAKASLERKKKAVISGIQRSIPALVAASPVDTGLYAASWEMTETERGAIIGNYAPYAGIIEYGARPFTPPLGPLLEWAKRVLTNSQHFDSDGTTRTLRNTGQPESNYTPEVWALAKYTQKKISERGMQPRHILQNSIPLIIENIRKEFESLGR